MSTALYRKYRSKQLDEIVGQNHVTDILARSLKQGRIAHAYLLTGPRGVGKTSIARILAHEINNLPYADDSSHLDIIEIDAASNNGVEDVRDLRDRVQVAPSSAKHKVYIIDEVHMLSKAAFNALLKTLEEPPAHVVFVLATTDADKLPATIISRTQRFTFRLVARPEVVKHLRFIADQESIGIEDDALELIAQRGEGSFRDSIGLLDQLQHLGDENTPITRQMIEDMLGLAPETLIAGILDAYDNKDLAQLTVLVTQAHASGLQATVLASQIITAIEQSMATKPQFIPLLDDLLDVARSPQPHIKLLTSLAKDCVVKQPKNVALVAPAPVVSASVETLKKAPSATPKAAAKPPTSRDDTPQATPEPAAAPKAQPTGAPVNLDWPAFIEHTRTQYVAIYSVLSKCKHTTDGGTITIYTGSAFYKKKLDDARHRLNLIKALEEVGAGGAIIEVTDAKPPLKDSQAAAIAAMMGGGEEVSIG